MPGIAQHADSVLDRNEAKAQLLGNPGLEGYVRRRFLRNHHAVIVAGGFAVHAKARRGNSARILEHSLRLRVAKLCRVQRSEADAAHHAHSMVWSVPDQAVR